MRQGASTSRMGIAHSWKSLSQASARRQQGLQGRLLRRYLREELYAFSPHYRSILDESGIDPRRVRSLRDLKRIPFSEGELLRRAGKRLPLLPTAHAIRDHWSFSRKLALSLGGKTALGALERAYASVQEVQSPAGPAVVITDHDLQVIDECLDRALDLLQVERGAAAVHVLSSPTGLGSVISSRSPLRAKVVVEPKISDLLDMLEREKPVLLTAHSALLRELGALAGAEKRVVDSLRAVVAIGGVVDVPRDEIWATLESLQPDVTLARVYGQAPMKLGFLELPDPANPARGTGFLVPPDLCVVEVIDPQTLEPVREGEPGELVFTTLCAHGSALLRYRTGDLAVEGLQTTPLPGSSLRLPRISSLLQSLQQPRSRGDECLPT